jgi:very-short-patch-repair endonuclease
MNQPEYIVGTILNEYDLDWEYERIFSNKNQGYLPDFTIENKKVVVEIYGDFWHANPKFFNKLDETHKGRKAFEIWAYDKKREEFFIKNGYKFIKIWEDDINKNINYVRKVLYDKTR